ncbi:linoleoyl-CoA desaturase [Dyella sp. OK004]|uniref:fatty acid desaturase family protein n=1 Tax=Dyella sp. OK004 TaxID=1855292 RepID=UPI0008F01735|nr:acyl-CoA desaturase [Dyella sp. OK004]SFS07487.1 linoleoyl-CoA desaturase [Dyella sp. OK004]
MSPESSHRTADAARSPQTDAFTDRLKFNGDNTFQRELRRRVEDYFKRSGHPQRDNARMYVKTAIILATFIASYVLLVFFAATWWQGLLLSIVLGFATAQIGFSIQHDAGHQAYSERRWVNRWMAMTLDLVGGSSYLWHWKHARFHHTYVNIDGYDSDISLGALARFSPQQKHHWHHRWQHIYLWMLYGLTVVSWHLHDDFRDIITGTIGKRRIPRPRGKDLAVFVLGKLVFFTLAFGLPLVFHSIGTVLLYYAVVAVVTGFQLAVVFQLAHAVEEATFPLPDESGRMDKPWAIHQLETTANFSRNSRVITWLVGGLNFQVEHHLFPRICHLHYPAISRVVEATCREYGVPYHVNRSFGAGIASHYRWLRRMGRLELVPEPPIPALVPQT